MATLFASFVARYLPVFISDSFNQIIQQSQSKQQKYCQTLQFLNQICQMDIIIRKFEDSFELKPSEKIAVLYSILTSLNSSTQENFIINQIDLSLPIKLAFSETQRSCFQIFLLIKSCQNTKKPYQSSSNSECLTKVNNIVAKIRTISILNSQTTNPQQLIELFKFMLRQDQNMHLIYKIIEENGLQFIFNSINCTDCQSLGNKISNQRQKTPQSIQKHRSLAKQKRKLIRKQKTKLKVKHIQSQSDSQLQEKSQIIQQINSQIVIPIAIRKSKKYLGQNNYQSIQKDIAFDFSKKKQLEKIGNRQLNQITPMKSKSKQSGSKTTAGLTNSYSPKLARTIHSSKVRIFVPNKKYYQTLKIKQQFSSNLSRNMISSVSSSTKNILTKQFDEPKQFNQQNQRVIANATPVKKKKNKPKKNYFDYN